MNLREAAQYALKELEYFAECGWESDAITDLRAALAEDAMQRLTDVQQEMDCYGDGNMYRGQRSSDSKTPTLTIKDNLTVEPVAYVPDATKMACPVAWAVITKGGKLYKAASTKESAERKAMQQIDKLGVEWECSVVPLYLSPTAVKMVATSQESRQDEPVAWMRVDRGHVDFHRHPGYLPLYTAPLKREPLTESFLEELAEKHVTNCYFNTLTYARAIERAHGIGGEE